MKKVCFLGQKDCQKAQKGREFGKKTGDQLGEDLSSSGIEVHDYANQSSSSESISRTKDFVVETAASYSSLSLI